MSYVRLDDQHDDGQLTQFRERLSSEVRVQTGQEFPIFQDRNDIAWGQAWQQRIDETLDAVTLLVVIITPSFFRSPACRAEVERFLERERELGRQDLILPVYYVSTPELDDSTRREADDLARVLASRQFADWRELRFEPMTSPVARKAIAQLANRMRDTFPHPLSEGSPRAEQSADLDESGDETVDRAVIARVAVAAKTSPPTHVVDPYGRGDYTTIDAAITTAAAGDRILVRPGLYRESLFIMKPVEIIGDGPVGDIEIHARDGAAVYFSTNIGRIANLTLRYVGTEELTGTVSIAQGRLELEGCYITTKSLVCVMIHSGADPRVRRNTISGSGRSGVLVFGDALGTLEENDIVDNVSGIHVVEGGNPTCRRNVIHESGGPGVYIYRNGLGTLEDNDIVDNRGVGIRIRESGRLTARGNRINRNTGVAVQVEDTGQGVLEDNDLRDNGLGAWDITAESGNVISARNRE